MEQREGASSGTIVLTKDWEMECKPEGNIYPISYKDDILFSSFENHTNCIGSYFKKNGQLNWKWCDTSTLQSPLYYNLISYIHHDILVLPNENTLYALDLKNGQLKWKSKNYDTAENAAFGSGENAYRTYYDKGSGSGTIVEIDVKTGSILPVCNVLAEPKSKLFLKAPFVSKNEKGDTVIICGIVRYDPQTRLTKNSIGTWLLKDGSLLSETPIVEENFLGKSIGKPPLVIGDLSYWVVFDELICYNHKLGKIKWGRSMAANMITSSPFVESDFIYYAGEGNKLIALNRFNGATLWNAEITGTPSRVFYANKHLFLVGGVDGALYIIDTEKGKVLEKKKADTHDIKNGVFFQRHLFADDDIVLLNDTQKWMCYKF